MDGRATARLRQRAPPQSHSAPPCWTPQSPQPPQAKWSPHRNHALFQIAPVAVRLQLRSAQNGNSPPPESPRRATVPSESAAENPPAIRETARGRLAGPPPHRPLSARSPRAAAEVFQSSAEPAPAAAASSDEDRK